MEYTFQSGDEFKIKPIKTRLRDRCLYPDKKFIISKITRTNIYYFDNRTNKKCKCRRCVDQLHREYNQLTGENELTGLKLIDSSEIELVRSKNQRQREILLKLLNI